MWPKKLSFPFILARDWKCPTRRHSTATTLAWLDYTVPFPCKCVRPGHKSRSLKCVLLSPVFSPSHPPPPHPLWHDHGGVVPFVVVAGLHFRGYTAVTGINRKVGREANKWLGGWYWRMTRMRRCDATMPEEYAMYIFIYLWGCSWVLLSWNEFRGRYRTISEIKSINSLHPMRYPLTPPSLPMLIYLLGLSEWI